MQALGMMSGTSLDGIDCAVLETDGEHHIEAGPSGFFAYAPADREILRAALSEAAGLSLDVLATPADWPAILRSAEQLVTQRHIEAAQAFCRDHGVSPDLIAMHGQTMTHRPDDRMSLQVGNGQAVAHALQRDVMADFRTADVRAGGQGAPLVPLFHAALMGRVDGPVAVLNLGGVANVTWLDGAGDILAFDTGPANALLDDWMMLKRDLAYDENGQLGASGTPDEAVLRAYLSDRYFSQSPPKSLDRLSFQLAPVHAAQLSDADGAATLTAFSAAAVVAGLSLCPAWPRQLIVCGGGRHNKTLLGDLAARLKAASDQPCDVTPCEALGWQGDALEAQAFAWLGVRALAGLPLSLPRTTGVSHPITGGVLSKA
jgi:anhydro-N-acetylmuramic acid kinase